MKNDQEEGDEREQGHTLVRICECETSLAQHQRVRPAGLSQLLYCVGRSRYAVGGSREFALHSYGCKGRA